MSLSSNNKCLEGPDNEIFTFSQILRPHKATLADNQSHINALFSLYRNKRPSDFPNWPFRHRERFGGFPCNNPRVFDFPH